MDIYRIRNDQDYKTALAEIDRLWGAEEGSPERDRFSILVDLVAAYEGRHHRIDPPSPIDAIKFRMEQAGLTRKDLEPMIGTRARVSEVLSGKRELTLPMIRRLSRGLGISADILAGTMGTFARAGRPGGRAAFTASRAVLVDAKYDPKGFVPRLLAEGITCT